jgi:hypothetical protein
MNNEIEKKLWNAGQEKNIYTQEIWHEIIDALLEDFHKLIGQDFQRDQKLNLNINNSCDPSFGQWIWAKKLENCVLSRAWSAVIGGNMVGTENGNDIFSVSLTLFLFDATTKRRLCLDTGESVIEFVFEKQSKGYGCWRILGWFKDENYEWENIEWGDFEWR